MKSRHLLVATIGLICALPMQASAQSSQPLDLKLPTDNAMVDAADAEAGRDGSVASGAAAPQAHKPNPYPLPSAFYYDDPNPRNHTAAAPSCDDASYNQPQVHGSVGVGVLGGNGVSGNYQTAVVNATKTLGSCGNPTGTVGVSVGVSKDTYKGSRRWPH
jgi:hypothetical protein